jgi:hypothetical protein
MNCKAALLLFSCSFIFGSLIADSGAASSGVEDAVLSLKAAFAKPISPEIFGKGDRTTRRSTVLSFTGDSRNFAYSAKSTSRTYSKATGSETSSPVVIVRTSQALFSDLKAVSREKSEFMGKAIGLDTLTILCSPDNECFKSTGPDVVMGSGGLHGAQPIQFADPEAAAEAKRAIEILIQANRR